MPLKTSVVSVLFPVLPVLNVLTCKVVDEVRQFLSWAWTLAQEKGPKLLNVRSHANQRALIIKAKIRSQSMITMNTNNAAILKCYKHKSTLKHHGRNYEDDKRCKLEARF